MNNLLQKIQPENVGFDFRGDVKVFDFGLCKSLSPKLKANNLQYGYKLTGRAGRCVYVKWLLQKSILHIDIKRVVHKALRP